MSPCLFVFFIIEGPVTSLASNQAFVVAAGRWVVVDTPDDAEASCGVLGVLEAVLPAAEASEEASGSVLVNGGPPWFLVGILIPT